MTKKKTLRKTKSTGKSHAIEQEIDDNLPVKERLLQVATTLFAEKGYDGTTVDEIVDTAKVNKNMVYYYFGNKDKLYLAAFEAAYAELEKLELSLIHDKLTPDQLIEKLVHLYFKLHHEHEALTRLVLWENLNRGKHLGGPKLKNTRKRAYEVVSTVLERGKKEGTVRKDIDEKMLMISIIGMCQIFASNRYTLSRGLSIDLNSNKVLQQGEQHVVRVLLRGITP